MIDLDETGACRTRLCSNTGKRARGARDIADIAAKTGVFDESFYCPSCVSAAASRSLQPDSLVQKLSTKRTNTQPIMIR